MNLFVFVLLLILFAFNFSLVAADTQVSDNLVILDTSSGKMVVELFSDDAPQTTSNFLNLAKQKFYDGTIFHRIIKNFMIQGGDPNTKDTKNILQWGYGGSGHTIPAEFNNIVHKRGIVSMARGNDPNSASSQFFIVHKDSAFLDEKYTVFGRLATQESYDTLDKIANLETTGPSTNYIPTDIFNATIQRVEIKKRSDVEGLLDQGEPQRMSVLIEPTQKYSNGVISFNITSTWSIQEATQKSPRNPIISLLGPQNDNFSPQILIFVRNSTSNSLEEFSDETKKLYSGLINQGSLVITNEEKTTINGNDAWVRNSDGKRLASDSTFSFRYRETVFKGDKEFYTITYVNTINDFDKSLPHYNQMLDSLKIEKLDTKNGGCLIATAVYGTELAPQVQLLREVRNNVLSSTGSGTAFMAGFNEFYYTFSPTVADWERQNPLFKESVKIVLYPMLSTLSILNYVDVASEQEMIGYGLLVIFVNTGMYFVMPITLILNRKKIITYFRRYSLR